MKCRGLVTVVAFVAMAGVGAGQARTQATAPAAKKAAPAEKKEKKDDKKESGEAKLQMKDLPPAVRATAEAETKGATPWPRDRPLGGRGARRPCADRHERSRWQYLRPSLPG